MTKGITDDVALDLRAKMEKLNELAKAMHEQSPGARAVVSLVMAAEPRGEDLVRATSISVALNAVNYLRNTAEHGWAPDDLVIAMREAAEIMKLSTAIIGTLEEAMTEPMRADPANLHEPNGSMQ